MYADNAFLFISCVISFALFVLYELSHLEHICLNFKHSIGIYRIQQNLLFLTFGSLFIQNAVTWIFPDLPEVLRTS